MSGTGPPPFLLNIIEKKKRRIWYCMTSLMVRVYIWSWLPNSAQYGSLVIINVKMLIVSEGHGYDLQIIFVYFSDMSQKYVGKQLLWLSSLHGLHPENSPLCPISWIYTMSPLTHSHQHKAHSFWWSHIYFAVFFMNRGKGSETKITWVGLGCVLRILKILLVQMVQIWQKENQEIYFFRDILC